MAISFTAYVVALGLQRALVSDPIVVATAALSPSERRARTQEALPLALGGETAVAIAIGSIGLALPGVGGRALLIVTIWIIPTLFQDFCRVVLFRDGRGRAASATDGLWVLVMAVAAPVAWHWHTDWAAIGVWGLGGLAGAMLGFERLGLTPRELKTGLAWWKAECWPFGRWLAGEWALYTTAVQGGILLIAGLLGVTALGGLRAVQTVFAPLSLLGPALSLPLLPTLTRTFASSPRHATVIAVKASVALSGAVVLYSVVVVSLGPTMLERVFGHGFSQFAYLIFPVALQQVLAAAVSGAVLLLKARRRGKSYLILTGFVPLVSLVFVALGAQIGGLRGVAWGYVATNAVGLVVTWIFVARMGRRGVRS